MATDSKDFKVKNGLVVTEGGTFGGTVSVATPTSNTHATTKLYVDDLLAGVGGGSITVSDTAPSNPSEGDLWYNSTDGSTYVYYDSFWVESTSAYAGPTGVVNVSSPITYDANSETIGIDLSSYYTSAETDAQITTAVSVKKTQVVQAISSDITLVSGYRYFVDTSASRNLTLPLSPSLGDEIQLLDSTGSAETYVTNVYDNGSKINGTNDYLMLNMNFYNATLIYTGATYGWRVS